MNYLMIDTAEGTRVLLFADGKYYYKENLVNAGAQTLMPIIDELISSAGITVADVDVFGAGIGPGSFTGLRVGLTTVKTLCYALGKKCFGVNNLRLNSYNNSSTKVVSVAAAGSNVCYIAVFDGEQTLLETKCVTEDDARAVISSYEGFAVSTDVKLKDKLAGTAGVGERELKIAAEKHLGTADDHSKLQPLYVRKAQPERTEGDL